MNRLSPSKRECNDALVFCDLLSTMDVGEDAPASQVRALQQRVKPKLSPRSGHLEDQSLELDARTLAVLGKREQLSVRRRLAQ